MSDKLYKYVGLAVIIIFVICVSVKSLDLNTQVIEANTDEGVLFPYGGIRIVVRVLYEFVRGTA